MAVKPYPDYISAVAALFGRGGPMAVVGLIVAIAAAALDRVLRPWPWSHVGKEVLEAVAPAIANGNPDSAVAIIACVQGVGAPLDHVDPRQILWCLAPAPRVPVLKRRRSDLLTVEATATLRVSALDPASRNLNGYATLAAETPDRAMVRRIPPNEGDRRQPMEIVTRRQAARLGRRMLAGNDRASEAHAPPPAGTARASARNFCAMRSLCVRPHCPLSCRRLGASQAQIGPVYATGLPQG